jgi:Uma2 family endonuclease
MASALPVPPITIEQYLAFESPEGYRDELINGRIIVSPEAKPLHSDVAENLYELLKAACGKKLHKVGQRMNLRFPDVDSMPSPEVYVIDLAEWQRARSGEVYPDGSKVLLAVEVISPSNRPGPLGEKVAIYTQHGIEAWVVDPRKQEVKVHRRGEPVHSASLRLKSVLQWNGKAVPLSAIFQLSSLEGSEKEGTR